MQNLRDRGELNLLFFYLLHFILLFYALRFSFFAHKVWILAIKSGMT